MKLIQIRKTQGTKAALKFADEEFDRLAEKHEKLRGLQEVSEDLGTGALLEKALPEGKTEKKGKKKKSKVEARAERDVGFAAAMATLPAAFEGDEKTAEFIVGVKESAAGADLANEFTEGSVVRTNLGYEGKIGDATVILGNDHKFRVIGHNDGVPYVVHDPTVKAYNITRGVEISSQDSFAHNYMPKDMTQALAQIGMNFHDFGHEVFEHKQANQYHNLVNILFTSSMQGFDERQYVKELGVVTESGSINLRQLYRIRIALVHYAGPAMAGDHRLHDTPFDSADLHYLVTEMWNEDKITLPSLSKVRSERLGRTV